MQAFSFRPGSVFLLACCAGKLTSPAPAADLYTSPLFRMQRQLAENCRADWYILSARHGLLEPSQVIAPYDDTLNAMDRSARVKWAQGVKAAWQKTGCAGRPVVMFAGRRYREELEPWLLTQAKVEVPLRGMGIGQQLHWLKTRISV